MWAGIDVGAPTKGLHAATVDGAGSVVLRHFRGPTAVADTIGWVFRARVIAVDSPASWAAAGERSRRCERAYDVTAIRYTPSEPDARDRDDDYYGWIRHGLALWSAAKEASLPVIECFPTGSWTQWCGPRVGSRSAWTRKAVGELCHGRLDGWEHAANQDERDALGAALTARQYDLAPYEVLEGLEPLVVPRRGTDPLGGLGSGVGCCGAGRGA